MSSQRTHADDIIATRWVMAIMRALAVEPARFTRLKNAVPGISANLLAERLRYLEEVGVVRKIDLPPPASCQVYKLTPLGAAARPILDAAAEWADLLARQCPPSLDKR